MSVFRAVLVAALGALALASQSAAGGFATVQLSSTPTNVRAGEPWSVDLTVLQHGRTPLEGISPLITLTNGVEKREVPATATGRPGVYHADVVFPSVGTWEWKIWDGFSQTHTYAPVDVTQPGGSGGGSGGRAWLAGLAGAAALAFGAAMLVVVTRKRPRPTPV